MWIRRFFWADAVLLRPELRVTEAGRNIARNGTLGGGLLRLAPRVLRLARRSQTSVFIGGGVIYLGGGFV